jgi:hypothetical protein
LTFKNNKNIANKEEAPKNDDNNKAIYQNIEK